MFAFDAFDSFLERYLPCLKREESLNHIILGSALLLQSQKKPPQYLAAVEEDGELLASALMIPGAKLLLAGSDDHGQPASEILAAHLHQRAIIPGSLFGPSPITLALTRVCSQKMNTAYEVGFVSYLHELTHLNQVSHPPGVLRLAGEKDIPLVLDWQKRFYQEALPSESVDHVEHSIVSAIQRREYVIWENPEPVAMAAQMRPGIETIAVSMVYTPQDQRGKGYGRAVTAALTRRLLDQGWKRCLLFTDITNGASNHIYKQLGYRVLGQFHNLNRR